MPASMISSKQSILDGLWRAKAAVEKSTSPLCDHQASSKNEPFARFLRSIFGVFIRNSGASEAFAIQEGKAVFF